ncbi:MAG: GreA/GreB family elongation factor [candidate division WOR-3 bacterium]
MLYQLSYPGTLGILRQTVLMSTPRPARLTMASIPESQRYSGGRLDLAGSASILLDAMEELIQQFRSHLGHKRLKELEGTWLELIEANIELDQLMTLAELVVRWASAKDVLPLLSVLAGALRDKGLYAEQMRVLRRQAELAPDDAVVARDLASCIQHLHPDEPLVPKLLQKAGLGYGQPLKESLAAMDRYLALLPGTAVFDAEHGPGIISSIDLLFDKVKVRFTAGVQSWETPVAFRRLRPSPVDGFFTLAARDPGTLAKLVESDPGRVVALYLRDIGRPAGIADIRSGLRQVVSPEAWDGFWTRARKGIAGNRHIEVLTSPARTYRWRDEPVVAARSERGHDRAATPAADASWLAAADVEELVHAYELLTTATARKKFIETLATARLGDRDEMLGRLFRIGRDSRARATIEKIMLESCPEAWDAVLKSSLTGYRQHPEPFVWLVENYGRLSGVSPRGLLSRMVDLLEHEAFKKLWTRLRKLLAESRYRLVVSALDETDEAEAARLLERIRRSRGIEQFRKDEIAAVFGAKFPALARDESGPVVWSSASGIERGRAELQRLLEVELPASADEIARARSHGDLSENYEYKAAKEKQARLMSRINRLRSDLAHARPIEPADVDLSQVSVGCRVELTDEVGASSAYSLLGPWDSDHERGIISYQSPLARALLGKKQGDRVEMDGRILTITAISPGLAG